MNFLEFSYIENVLKFFHGLSVEELKGNLYLFNQFVYEGIIVW